MVRIAALAFAAALPLASAAGRLGMPKDHPVKADHIGDAPIPTLPGTLVGYVNYGLSESSCTSSYPTSTGTCTLESYQLYPTLSATPIAYGDRLIIQSSSPYSYYKTQFTSLSPTLQNLTTRNFDLRQDCAVPLYTPTLSYGAMQMPPRPVFQKDPVSGNGSLVPEVKDLRMQILAFNTSDNYTLPNQTYFRVYDVDMSREAECSTTEVGPDVEKQREMNLGVGSLRCAVRADVVDSNITGVVRSTHHALVVHDLSGSGSYATCRGTDSRGYQQSCHRLVSLTSYSNGTKGDVTVRDLTNFPLDFTFDSATPCFYDNNTDAIALVGTSGSNDAQILRIDNLKNMYYTPTVTTVRTLDSSIVRSAGSLMNTDGNIGFLSGNSLLVYSLSGDKLVNKTIAVAPSTYSTLQYPVYTAQRSVIPGTEE